MTPATLKRPASLADEVASDLRRCIFGSVYKQGQQLPTEKLLSESYGVSRTVIREAVAQLKTEALVDVRQGAGAFVAASGQRLFRIGGTPSSFDSLRHIYELRSAVEVGAARLAAERRTSSDVRQLERLIEEMDDPATRANADTNFHLAIAAATANDIYARFVAFIGNTLSSTIQSAVENTILRHATQQALVIAEHRAIADAIIIGDAARAASAMSEHLDQAMSRLFLREQK